MGRTRLVPIVVTLYYADQNRLSDGSEWRSRAKYGAPGYGMPTVANLKKYIKKYNDSLRPGGVNDHIGRRGRATGGRIVDQRSGHTLAEWRAPMFSTDPSDFEVLYKD